MLNVSGGFNCYYLPHPTSLTVQWSKTALVTGDMANFDMRCDDIGMAIRLHLRKQNITMTLQLSSDNIAVNLDSWMERIKSRSRS